MKIEELENSLPNGFHDADLQSLAVDYRRREAVFKMRVWVGSEEPTPMDSGRMPIMRDAQLSVRGLDYVIIGPPQTLSETEGRVLDVSGYLGVPSPEISVPRQSEGAFVYSFYVSNWDNFIIFAAQDAELHWVGQDD